VFGSDLGVRSYPELSVVQRDECRASRVKLGILLEFDNNYFRSSSRNGRQVQRC